MKHAGHQDELGFNIRGTTDVALVDKQALGVGLPRVGIKWLWELKKRLQDLQASPQDLDEVQLLYTLLKIKYLPMILHAKIHTVMVSAHFSRYLHHHIILIFSIRANHTWLYNGTEWPFSALASFMLVLSQPTLLL